jgi:hypothetical protein
LGNTPLDDDVVVVPGVVMQIKDNLPIVNDFRFQPTLLKSLQEQFLFNPDARE